MCGVVGAIGRGEDFQNKLRFATAALSHRGIRQKVVFTEAGGVGHVRLPIVGLGEEHDQPMQTKIGGWTVGFVGELLDFKEKYVEEFECDAELVAELWGATGPHGFKDHDGFWGIVALRGSALIGPRLHVLTDYLGQKPMYYRTDMGAAASEPDALLQFGPVTLDEVYLSACVKWGYCPDVTRTPYNEVKHALPGEHVILNEGGVMTRQIVDRLFPLHDLGTEQLRLEIESAVRRRVQSSDVPVAALVSGGIDSAIVYKLAQRYGNVVPYCAVSNDDDSDLRAAQRVVHISDLNVIHYDTVNQDEAMRVMQEPIDLGSLRPQVALAKAIPQSVCLTGDGADELFGGYERSLRYDSQYSDVFMELPAWHLPRLDRAMMHNKVEVRSPFLARRVVEMALALPHEARRDKRLLRQLFTDILPPAVTEAKKKALRTDIISKDREAYSMRLVQRFREQFNDRRRQEA